MQGQNRHIQSEYSCPNGRLPYCFYLSWELPTKVPRQVLRADYELWRIAEPRFKRSASWENQLKEFLDRGLTRNKTEGRRSNASLTVTGEVGEPDYKRKRSPYVKTDIFVKTGTWKESSVAAYEFPPLKEIWSTAVKAEWIRPGGTVPIEELTSASTEIDTPAGDN